jgi:putative hydrolase
MADEPSPNPFEGMFGDLAKLLGSLGGGGPVNWEVARQFATFVAGDGAPESNVDPIERIKLEELLRIADLHVAQATGLDTTIDGRARTMTPVSRGEWARRALDGLRRPLEALATSLASADDGGDDIASEQSLDAGDPMAGLLGTLPQILGPFMMAAMAGSMVGHLAQRTFGQYDLPLPRTPSPELVVVPQNMAAFASEWELPEDDLRLWVCLHELTHAAVLRVPHVHETLSRLLLEYAGAVAPDAGALEQKLGDIDPSDPSSFQRVLGDPEAMLGMVQSDTQRALLPRIAALTSVIEGYVDHVMDSVGRGLICSYGQLSEALRRRRVEDAAGTRYAGRLFGLDTSREAYERGAAFVRGVVERDPDGLARLWSSERNLPTPAEVDAPGLWLARIEFDDDDAG